MTPGLFLLFIKVWDDISWVYGSEEAGADGEIVGDGNYQLNDPACFQRLKR
jgi:hypothetical protein